MFNPANAYSRFDRVSVECAKHPYQWLPVDICLSLTDSITDLIDETFDRCVYCLDEKKWVESRWPEGAEL